jgi:predicted DNA-binding protein (MmcQ/YjbR family)
MNLDEFDAICGDLAGATFVVQWGGTHVWKVGGKIFAVAGLDGGLFHLSFKARPFALPLMLESGDFFPAPYLARAGWVALKANAPVQDEDLRLYLIAAHAEIMAKLPRKSKSDLSLPEPL